jgi:hypothetical protein
MATEFENSLRRLARRSHPLGQAPSIAQPFLGFARRQLKAGRQGLLADGTADPRAQAPARNVYQDAGDAPSQVALPPPPQPDLSRPLELPALIENGLAQLRAKLAANPQGGSMDLRSAGLDVLSASSQPGTLPDVVTMLKEKFPSDLKNQDFNAVQAKVRELLHLPAQGDLPVCPPLDERGRRAFWEQEMNATKKSGQGFSLEQSHSLEHLNNRLPRQQAAAAAR